MTLSRTLCFIATLSLCLSLLNTAQANPFTDAEDAVKYRQQALSMMRDNFGIMSAMARGDRDYDAEQFKQRAKAVYHLSYIPWDAFQGVGERVTENSDALPVIWENWSDFESRISNFQQAVQELVEAADSGNMREIRPKFMTVARNCQQCHQGYRAD
ncbi:MAG: cytochrome c [Idiomarina sp.]|nr:cytochrome c [Idiomarina sp.]